MAANSQFIVRTAPRWQRDFIEKGVFDGTDSSVRRTWPRWLIASALFSWYVSSYASYNETYGSLGAVVILLMWFYLTAYIFLIGAELGAEMEHQTNRDTTEGEEKPMGQRGAYVADTVGEKP